MKSRPPTHEPRSPSISVVVPCFNEAEGITECHRRITEVLRSLNISYEIVYVDDGSRDETLSRLAQIHAADPHVAIIELSRNFGHQPAVTAGLEAATGQAVVVMDADLQDPPELIPAMLDKWAEGYEVVYAVRESRERDTGFKRWTAKAFYRLINLLSEIEIPPDAGDFRLLDRKAVEAMKSMPERHRFLRGMCSWVGFRQCGIKYARGPRFAGSTKYPVRKMVNLAVDAIASFSTVPLRVLAVLGLASAFLALLGIIYALVVRLFTNSWVAGWAISFIVLLFLGGLQMMSIGILGEYVGRIYTETKQRPLYIARAVLERRGGERPVIEDQELESISTRRLS